MSTDLARTFRDNQTQNHALREKEKAIAAKKIAVEELRKQVMASQEEYNRRRTALTQSTRHIQPLQADVEAQWAQRNAFTASQDERLREIESEEQQLSDKIDALNMQIVQTVAMIDRTRGDAALLEGTDQRIIALERQVESDAVALSHLERLVANDDVAVGERIERFDVATGNKYPVDFVDVAMRGIAAPAQMGGSSDDNGASRTRGGGLYLPQLQQQQEGGGNRPAHRRNSKGAVMPSTMSSIRDIEHSMMLMGGDDDDCDEGGYTD